MKIESFFVVDAGSADTTVQWVYWNNKGPAPFEPSGTLSSFTFATSVAGAIAGNGFTLGDTSTCKIWLWWYTKYCNGRYVS